LTDHQEPPLEVHIQRHAEAIADFITSASQISADSARVPRAPGKWTPGQEVLHLVLTYTAFRSILDGGPEFTLMVPEERAAELQRTVLPRILTGAWFPSGGAAHERTQPDCPSAALSDALLQLALAVDAFHAAVRSAAATATERRWTHPYFGPMRLPDLIDVLTGHVQHHGRFLPRFSGGAG
jgi:hypothetical protein